MKKIIFAFIATVVLLACHLEDQTHSELATPHFPNEDAGSDSSDFVPNQDLGNVKEPSPPSNTVLETHHDGIKNLDETDIDCGHSCDTKCNIGQGCAKHADCVSDVCGSNNVCLPVSERSCSSYHGGMTCGVGEDGDPKAKHVSCCETAPLFNDLQNVKLDRFLITAGRMRTFIERTKGDVRSFVHTLPLDVWHPEYDEFVPSSIAEANVQLGSFFNKKSCQPGFHTGRTYWTSPTPDDFSDYTQDQMDEKALNCVSWHLVKAFCAWDGGRLPTSDEIKNAFTNGGLTIQPWLLQPNATQYVQIDPLVAPWTSIFNHGFSYGYPLPSMRAPGFDVAYFISAPGRFPQSWNQHGHEIAGNVLNWNSDEPYSYSKSFSWENHGSDGAPNSNWKIFQDTPLENKLYNGYYALGGRCAR